MQGKTIWILSFFSVLSGLSAIHAIILWINLGIDGIFQPPLIGGLTGGIPIWAYLLISIIATFIFLGGTSVRIVGELSNKDLLNEINAKVSSLESGQKLQQKFLESLQARVFLVDESLDTMRKEVAKSFSKQEEEIKQVHTNLVNRFDSKLVDAKNGITKQLGQIENSMAKYEQSNKKSAKTILAQMGEIVDIRLKVEKLEDELTKMPKPQLTSQNKPEEVRGIGENTGNALREMGITTVDELVFTDAAVIAEKTGISEKMVEKLQGRAQLAMVPSVKEKDMVLLEEAGVTNRQELANQDPLELGRKINEIVKVHLEEGKMSEAEKPTIEEIYSWVKFAKV